MVSYKFENNILMCQFPQRLDSYACEEFYDAILDKVKESKIKDIDGQVVFELGNVEFVSSLFLRICLRVARETGKERFLIQNVNNTVLNVFQLTGFDKTLQIKDSAA